MRCRVRMSARSHPYALAYHLAAHAVVAERLDLPLISVRLDRRRRTGAVHILMEHRDPDGSRMPVERDALCASAGIAAQERGCGFGSWLNALEDCATVSKRLSRFTRDAGERAAWGLYLQERARVLVRTCWHEITVIAAVLHHEGAMDGASLGATLEAFRVNPFRSDLRPLRPIPWTRPARPPGGTDEVELLWSKPKLSEVVARMRR